jgi:hypothetical protein
MSPLEWIIHRLITPSVYELLDINSLLIIIFIMATLIAIESGIILGLSSRVGGLRRLLRVSIIPYHNGDNSTQKSNPSTKNINNEDYIN